MSDFFAFLWKVVVGAFALAIKRESSADKAVKIAFMSICIVAAVFFQEPITLSISISGGPVHFPPAPAGITITIVVFLCIFSICFAISWVTTPRLVFSQITDLASHDGHYGVYLINKSFGRRINKCRVRLETIDPSPDSYRPVGVSLHCSGKVFPTEYVDIDPRIPELFDVLKLKQNNELCIVGYHEDVWHKMTTQEYRLTLIASGEGVATTRTTFIFRPMGNGVAEFFPENAPSNQHRIARTVPNNER